MPPASPSQRPRDLARCAGAQSASGPPGVSRAPGACALCGPEALFSPPGYGLRVTGYGRGNRSPEGRRSRDAGTPRPPSRSSGPRRACPWHRRALAPERSARSPGDSRLEIGPRGRSHGAEEGRAQLGGLAGGCARSGAAQAVSPATAQPGGRGGGSTAGSALPRPACQRAHEYAPIHARARGSPPGPSTLPWRCPRGAPSYPPTHGPPLACVRVCLENSYRRGRREKWGTCEGRAHLPTQARGGLRWGKGAIRALDAQPLPPPLQTWKLWPVSSSTNPLASPTLPPLPPDSRCQQR